MIDYKFFLRWIIYFGLIFVIFIIQNSPNIPYILGVKPLILVPVIGIVSFFERNNNFILYLFCFFLGFLCDFTGSKFVGFNSVLFILMLCMCEIIFGFLKPKNFLCSFFVAFICILFYELLDFIVSYFIWGYNKIISLIFYYSFTLIILSSIFIPLLYVIIKFFHINLKSD